jgi:hypothetical protein
VPEPEPTPVPVAVIDTAEADPVRVPDALPVAMLKVSLGLLVADTIPDAVRLIHPVTETIDWVRLTV